jgi:tetratricopeptide (TPR) repeat protein
MTFRPEFVPSWRGQPHVTLLTLNRLSRRQAVDLIASLSAGPTLSQDTLEQILSRSDGIPLYLEELAKTVLEDRGDADTAPSEASPRPALIPASLHDSLAARLDRYPSAKRVAQCGAVIGREFSYRLLREITPEGEADLQAAVQQLVTAELVFARGSPPDATYSFKHALVRDAAYGGLLKTRRQQLHARIADTLEADQHVSARQPELVAHHLSEARLPERAVAYWERAAHGAAARHAHQEAIGHCTRGLETVRLISDHKERLEHELKLEVRLGTSARTITWAAPEAGRAYYRARELCAELQDDRLMSSILVGLFYFHSNRAETLQAEALGLELLTLGDVKGDRVLQAFGHMTLVDARYKLGNFNGARRHLEQGMGVYNAAPWPKVTVEGFDDPGPNSLIYGSAALWMLGYPERADETIAEAVVLARRSGHRLSIAHAIYMAGHLCELAGDWQAVQRANDETITVAEEWGLIGLRQAVARRQRLVAVALQSDADEIAYKRRNPQPGFARSLHEAVVAQALARTGEPEEGLSIVEAAVRWSEETSSLFYHAELHRVWAELLVQIRRMDEAERKLDLALTIARQQGARMWELRAAHDLAQLWQLQGRSEDAYGLLAPIYGWFSEGFGSPDLQTAKALLEVLAPLQAAGENPRSAEN